MSEKIYVCLLRLCPSHFRSRYGDDALQLFRDRYRDEIGFAAKLRLWLDLLADLAVSVPRMRRHIRSPLAGALAQPWSGMPSFQVLEGESLRVPRLLFGAALSLFAFTVCIFFITHGRNRPLLYLITPSQNLLETGETAAATGQTPAPPPLAGQDPGSAPPLGDAQTDRVDAAERSRVIQGVIANLRQHYIDRDVAERVANALVRHETAGDYDALTDGAAFAGRLTGHVQAASHDPHLDVVYSRRILPERPPAATPEGLARYRKFMEQENCTFETIAIRPHNIGYLKLNSFPDSAVCGKTAAAAMARLNNASAIIFDLRDNIGGFASGISQIASYLFDHPEFLFSPRDNVSLQSWTRSPVPGNKLADKPVYILTSPTTISAAEMFTYNMKMLRRATLVGETTRGAAHAAVFHRIDDHFGTGVLETKPINPYASVDWEGTGVAPDVKVNAAAALETAEKLALQRLRQK